MADVVPPRIMQGRVGVKLTELFATVRPCRTKQATLGSSIDKEHVRHKPPVIAVQWPNGAIVST